MFNQFKERIYSVGAVDGDVRIFHGYQTPVGTTYNAYLILDRETVLVDFVKAPFASELIANIKAVLGGRKLDRIICNHAEPDHSGAMPEVVKAFPEAVMYGTAACKRELNIYYPDAKYEFVTVGKDDTLCTGDYTFRFIPMPMVHWPDSMSTYLEEEQILFSNDALGQHIGTGEWCDSQLDRAYLLERAGDYYANIVLPFGMQVQKLLASVTQLPLKAVCPSHGVILEDAIGDFVKKYNDWSTNYSDPNRTVIVYDTMWGTTRKMALQLQKEEEEAGREVRVFCLSEVHYSQAMSACLEAGRIFVGSSTLNNQMLPSVAAFLTYFCGLKPKNRVGMAFGSYGWSGESIKHVDEKLAGMGFEMLPARKVLWNVD